MEYYRQCELKNGNLSTVAWIPEHGAKEGYSFLLKHDKKSGRWTVGHVGETKLAREDIKDSDIFESIKEKERT